MTKQRTLFRPCIDLHEGRVKQIVGGTLDSSTETLKTNFVSDKPPSWFAGLYARDSLCGGHVIMLGPGNEAAAKLALAAYPNGLQIGGGIRPGNAEAWLAAGASHVIATSCFFDSEGRFQESQLKSLVSEVGTERLVIDLSCRRVGKSWFVAMNRWQLLTNVELSGETLDILSEFCAEFLIHAADVEGKCEGIDEDLVSFLGLWAKRSGEKRPVTYAGGASSLDDLERVETLSGGQVDLTIGSALDIFGGAGVAYADCVAFNRSR